METRSKLEYSISSSSEYAKVDVTGSPSLEEFKEVVSPITLSTLCSPGMKIVCDFSDAILSHISDLQYLSFRTYAFFYFKKFAPSKIAIVGGSSRDTLAVLKKSLVHENVRVFYQRSHAISWIESP